MQPTQKTLFDFFSEYAAERGDDRFIFDEGNSYTVSQAFHVVKRLASRLCAHGVRNGARVALKAERTMHVVFVYFALQFLGATAVMYDPREKIAEKIRIEGETLYLDDEEIPLSPDTSEDGEEEEFLQAKEGRTVIFTSGSTGEKKAVLLGQYNFVNNSLDTVSLGGYRPEDVNILIVPVYHVFGVALVITAIVAKHCVFIPQKIDAEYVLDCMEKYGVTRLNGVPSMYLSLAEKKGRRKLSSLNCGLIGGGPCTKEQFVRIEKTLGITLIPVYGMSECIGISCGNSADPVEKRCNGVGKPYPMNEVTIAEDGEILVESPFRAMGYEGNDPFPANEPLHTGDLGFFDEEGYLHIDGRKKDIVIRNGNNLSTAAIERKILSVRAVKNVCVVGVPDEKQGEVPCALIVSGRKIGEELGKILTGIEFPKEIRYVKEIPLTATGKPDKPSIRKSFM